MMMMILISETDSYPHKSTKQSVTRNTPQPISESTLSVTITDDAELDTSVIGKMKNYFIMTTCNNCKMIN